jgi:hypothetical protein
MNRETKIGLVTGVTLIVLIGAMLSSYLSAPRKQRWGFVLNRTRHGHAQSTK